MAATTTTEPEWNDEERGWSLALEVVEARACSGCGRPQSQVWGEDRNEGHIAAEPHVCVACLVSAKTVQDYLGQRKGFPASAVKITTKDRRRA